MARTDYALRVEQPETSHKRIVLCSIDDFVEAASKKQYIRKDTTSYKLNRNYLLNQCISEDIECNDNCLTTTPQLAICEPHPKIIVIFFRPAVCSKEDFKAMVQKEDTKQGARTKIIILVTDEKDLIETFCEEDYVHLIYLNTGDASICAGNMPLLALYIEAMYSQLRLGGDLLSAHQIAKSIYKKYDTAGEPKLFVKEGVNPSNIYIKI